MGNKWIKALWQTDSPAMQGSHFSIRTLVDCNSLSNQEQQRAGSQWTPQIHAVQNTQPARPNADATINNRSSSNAWQNAIQPLRNTAAPAFAGAQALAKRPPVEEPIERPGQTAQVAAIKRDAVELAALTRQTNKSPSQNTDASRVETLAKLPPEMREQYENSIKKLESNVHEIATALSTLDAIDLQLFKARQSINALRSRGAPVDCAKVRNVLEAMTQHVHSVVQTFDKDSLNLLRDTRMKIAFAQPDSEADADQSVVLQLISFDKLMKLSRTLNNDPVQIERFIETLSRALDGNIQVLSSLMLSLFAARDYTVSVTDLALESNAIRPVKPVSSETRLHNNQQYCSRQLAPITYKTASGEN